MWGTTRNENQRRRSCKNVRKKKKKLLELAELRGANGAEFGQVGRRTFNQSYEIKYEMQRRPERNYNWRTKGWKDFDYRRYNNRRGCELDDIWRPNYDDDDDDDDDVRCYPNWNSQYPCYNNRSTYQYPNNHPYQHIRPAYHYGYPTFMRNDTYRNQNYKNRCYPQQSNFNNSSSNNVVVTKDSSYSNITTDSSNRSDGIDGLDSVVSITEDHSENNKMLDDDLVEKLESLHGKNVPKVPADIERESELLPNLEGPMLNLLEVLSNNNDNNASSNVIAGTIADTHRTIDIIRQSNKRLENTSMQQKRYNDLNLTTLNKNCSFLPGFTRDGISEPKKNEIQSTSKDNLKINTNTTITIQLSSFETREVINSKSNIEEPASSNENVLVTDNVNSNVSDTNHSCKETVSHTTDSSEIILFNNRPIVNHSSISKSPHTSSSQNDIEILPDQGDKDCEIIFLNEKLQLKSSKHIQNGTPPSSDKLIKNQHVLNTQVVVVSSPIDTETFTSDSSVHGANSKQNGKLSSDVNVSNSSSSRQSTSKTSIEHHSSCSAPMQNSYSPVEIVSKVNHTTMLEYHGKLSSDLSVSNSSSSRQSTSKTSSEHHSSCSAPMQNSDPPVEIVSKVNHTTMLGYHKGPNGNGNVCESKTAYRKTPRQEDCENSVDIHNNQGKYEHKKHSDKTHCHKKKPTKPLNEVNNMSITHIKKHSKTGEEPRSIHKNENTSESSVNNNQLVLSKERETSNSSSNKNNTSSTSRIDNLHLHKNENTSESNVNNNQLVVVLSKERETSNSSSNKNNTSSTSRIDNLQLRKISNRRKTIAHVGDDKHVTDNGGTPKKSKHGEMVHKKIIKTLCGADICNSHIQKRRKTEDESHRVKLNEKIELPKQNDSKSNAKETTLLLEKKTVSSNKNKEPSFVENAIPLKAHKRRKTISEWCIESGVDNHHHSSSSQPKTHLHKRKPHMSSTEGSSNQQRTHVDVDSSVVKWQSVPLEGCNNNSNKINEDSIAPVTNKVPVLKIHKRRHTFTQQIEDTKTRYEIVEHHKEESSLILVNESVSHKSRPVQIQSRRKSIIVSPERNNVSLNTNKHIAKKANRSIDSNNFYGESTQLPTDNRSVSLIESDTESDLSIITCRSSSSERNSKYVQPQPIVLIENCLPDLSSRKSEHSLNRPLVSKASTEENVMIPLKEYVLPAYRKSDNKSLNKSQHRNSKFIQLFGPDSDDETSRKSRNKRLQKKSSHQNQPDIPWKLQKVDDYISSIKHAHKSTCEEFETTVELKANDKLETAKCGKVEAELDTSASLIITRGKVYSDTVVIKQPCNRDSEIERVKEINNLMQMHCASSSATIEDSNSRKSTEEVVCTPDILNSGNCSQQPTIIQPSPTLTWDYYVSTYNSEQLDTQVAENSGPRRSSRSGNIKITPLRSQMSTNIATSTPMPSTAREAPNFNIYATYDDFCCAFWKDVFSNLKNSEMIIKQRNYFCKIGFNAYESNGSLSNYQIAWAQSIELLAARILNFFTKHTMLPGFNYKEFLKHCYYYGGKRGHRVTLPSLVKLMFAVVCKIKNAHSHLDGFIKEFSTMVDEEYQQSIRKKIPTQLDVFLLSCDLVPQPPPIPSVYNIEENSSLEVTHNPVRDSTHQSLQNVPPTNENELPKRGTTSTFTLIQADIFLSQMEQYRLLIRNYLKLMKMISQQRYGTVRQEQPTYSSSSCRFQAGVTVHQYPRQMCIQSPPPYPSQNLPRNSVSPLNSSVRSLGCDSPNANENLTHTSYVASPQHSNVSASSDQLVREILDHVERTTPVNDISDNFRIRLPLSVPRTEENATNSTPSSVLHTEVNVINTTPPNTPEPEPETASVQKCNVIKTENSSLQESTSPNRSSLQDSKSQNSENNEDVKNILSPIFPFEEDEVIDVDQWFIEKMRQQDFIDLDDYDMDVVPNQDDVKLMIVNPDVLGGERFCICSNKAQLLCLCGLAIYCSQKCQSDDWCNHRSICTSTREKKNS